MSTEVDKSIKLVFNEFQKSISEVPLEVYYQTIQSDQFNQNGYQFNIKQPGIRALLDTDIWIEYDLEIIDKVANGLYNSYANNAGNVALPATDVYYALRSGNVMQRATQNFNLQINNQTLNVRPTQFIDVLNRIYVSNDQSEHEFSSSGGRFDEGNHSGILEPYYNSNWFNNRTFAGYGSQFTQNQVFPVVANAGGAAPNANSRIAVVQFAAWAQPFDREVALNDVQLNMYPNVPKDPEFYNPGLNQRYYKFSRMMRENISLDDAPANVWTDLAVDQFDGTPLGGNISKYSFRIIERLPMPLFKMYSNDEVFGVIPNIHTMQITGIFGSNLDQLVLRSSSQNDNIGLYWGSNLPAKLFLRWYTPPMVMNIPKEIHVPYKKIVNWNKAITLTSFNPANLTGVRYTESDVSEYNISLEAIPDLLLIYVKYRSTEYNYITPDDYLLELRNLSINIDNASGKLNQIQSIDLYNKWKKLLKHSDNRIINYEEWRRYCFVACLQPEDYGVRYGPGYSNQTVLGIKCTARNWYMTPSILFQDATVQGGYDFTNNRVETTKGELNVTSIYYKNKLVIRDDGTCQQELTKVSADFDMMRPQIGGMGLGQAGTGMLNA